MDDFGVGGSALTAADCEGDAPVDQPVAIATDHYRCTVVIVNTMGLHARPATMFVQLSNKYQCQITLQKGSEKVDGKSILQLLSLSAEAGTPLVLESQGPDAKDAIFALVSLVAGGFGEKSREEKIE